MAPFDAGSPLRVSRASQLRPQYCIASHHRGSVLVHCRVETPAARYPPFDDLEGHVSSKPPFPANTPYLSEFDREWDRIDAPSEQGPNQPVGSHANRRRGERVATQLPVIVAASESGVPVYCLSTDLSLSGAHLDLSAEFLPDVDVIRVWLALPDQMLHVLARPVRTTAQGRAVEFVRVERAERARLALYIHELRVAARRGSSRVTS